MTGLETGFDFGTRDDTGGESIQHETFKVSAREAVNENDVERVWRRGRKARSIFGRRSSRVCVGLGTCL